MLTLEFTLLRTDDVYGGFELGHLSVDGLAGRASSMDTGSRGALMVFTSAASLLDAVRRFLGGTTTSSIWVADGSSFAIRMKKTRRQTVELTVGGQPIGILPARELAVAVHYAVARLAPRDGPQLDADTAASQDIRAAQAQFARFLSG